MLTILVTIGLALVYGLAWHNQPSKDRQSERRSKQE
jgi:hypothetical protein